MFQRGFNPAKTMLLSFMTLLRRSSAPMYNTCIDGSL